MCVCVCVHGCGLSEKRGKFVGIALVGRVASRFILVGELVMKRRRFCSKFDRISRDI